MAALVILLLIYAFIIWLEVPPLIRNRSWRELAVFTVISLLALALGIPWSLEHKIFFPAGALNDFFEPLAQIILGPMN